MADQRDAIAQAMMAQNTGGLTPGDFATFSQKLNDPTALQAWLDKGGVYGQSGMTPPDPDEQYFGNKGTPSGSVTDVGWMQGLQPWQGGEIGGQPGSGMNRSGFIGGGSAARADPAYWGYQGRHQGYAPGSMGDVSGFNAGRGGGSGGTGGLTPQDFATFSRLVSPQELQRWLDAGGVQGMAGGGMGGSAGGGGGGGGGGVGSVGSVGVGGVGNAGNNANTGNNTAAATLGGGYSMGGIGSDAHRGPEASLSAAHSAANAANSAATAAALSNSFGAQSGALGENVAADLGALGEGWGGVGASPY